MGFGVALLLLCELVCMIRSDRIGCCGGGGSGCKN